MIYPAPERVGSFIIRKNGSNQYELLTFQQIGCENAPIQVPGGGIEPGESVEAALYREIDEESGLTQLRLIRKLGVFERCWLDSQRTSRRHYFLLEAAEPTLDCWEYVVQGKGLDAGYRYAYCWQRPPIDFDLLDSARFFLTPEHIPELFA